MPWCLTVQRVDGSQASGLVSPGAGEKCRPLIPTPDSWIRVCILTRRPGGSGHTRAWKMVFWLIFGKFCQIALVLAFPQEGWVCLFYKMDPGTLVWELIFNKCVHACVYVRVCFVSPLRHQWAQLRTWDSRSNLPECVPWLENWPAVWPWTNYLTSLNLSLLICSVGMMISTSPRCYEDRNNVRKVQSPVPATQWASDKPQYRIVNPKCRAQWMFSHAYTSVTTALIKVQKGKLSYVLVV